MWCVIVLQIYNPNVRICFWICLSEWNISAVTRPIRRAYILIRLINKAISTRTVCFFYKYSPDLSSVRQVSDIFTIKRPNRALLNIWRKSKPGCNLPFYIIYPYIKVFIIRAEFIIDNFSTVRWKQCNILNVLYW